MFRVGTFYQERSGKRKRTYFFDLTIIFQNLFKSFSDIEMKGNSGKFHLILSTNEPAVMQVREP